VPPLAKNRNFLVLTAGQWVSQVGNTLFTMAASWAVLSLTGSRFDLGLVSAVSATAGAFAMVAGAVADRVDRRWALVVTDGVRAAVALLAAAGLLTGRLPFVAILGVVFVLGLGGALFGPAMMGLIPHLVPPEDLAAANGVNGSAPALASLVGSGLGGALLALARPWALFAGDGVSFALSAGSLALLHLPRRPLAGRTGLGPGRWWDDIRAGQTFVWRHPLLRRIIPTAVVLNFCATGVGVLEVAWVRQVLHLGGGAYGLFGVAELLGLMAGSLGYAAVGRRLGRGIALYVAVDLAEGLGLAFLSRLPILVPDLILLGVMGVASGVINAAVATDLQRDVPDELRGRVVGTLFALATVAAPLGALAAGAAASVASLPAVVLAIGALALAAGVPLLRPSPPDVAQAAG